MKALIISDDDAVINSTRKVLENCGFETIIYRWLLKALDNVEEIAPDLAVISVSDYPRHWKTFAQFVQSGIGGKETKVILYTPADFNSEEKKKAEVLGIKGFFSSCSESGLADLKSALKDKKETQKIQIIISEPEKGTLITGNAEISDNETYSFSPDIPSFISEIKNGARISMTVNKDGKYIFYNNAIVKSAGAQLIICSGNSL